MIFDPSSEDNEKKTKAYSTKEVAQIVGVHKNTLLNWIRDGKIPDVRRDWKQYRIWTERDVEHIREYKEKVRQLTLGI